MAQYHVFTSPIADGTNTQLVRPSDYNSVHKFVQTISGNTAGQSTFSGTNMVFQGGDNVTLSANTAAGAATLIISAAAGTGGGAALQGSGTYTQNSGTVQFANSNGVTFGLSNNGVMTASVGAGAGAALQGSGTYTQNSGTIQFANSNGITFGLSNNGVMSASHNAAQSDHSHGNPTLALTNLTGTTASNSAGFTLSLSAGVGGAGDGVNILAAGSQTANTTGSVLFQNSNGITFGMSNNSQITASHNGIVIQSTQPVAVSGSNGSFTFSTLSMGNSNGLQFYTTGGSVVGSYTVPSQSAMGFSGSNGSFTASTLSFGASNGLTFYTTQGSIVASYTDAGAGGGDGYNIVQAGTTGTTGTTWSALSASVYLNGSNGVIVSQNNSNQIAIDGSNFATAVHIEGNTSGASSIQIQGQAMHWCGGNNITLSANGSSVTISADKIYGNLVPVGNWPASIQSFGFYQGIGQNSCFPMLFPYSLDQNWSGDHIMIPMSNNWVSSTNTGTQQITYVWGLYTNNANTLSLMSSNSMGMTITVNSNSGTINYPTTSGTTGYGYNTTSGSSPAQLNSLVGSAGIRLVDMYFSNTLSLSSGMYWLGLHKKEATNAIAAGLSIAFVGNILNPVFRRWPLGVNVTVNISSNWIAPFVGFGHHVTLTGAIPNTFPIAAFPPGTASNIYTHMCVTFDNGSW